MENNMGKSTEAILHSPSFQKLLHARKITRIVLTLLSIFSYTFFVGGIVFYKDWFASPISLHSSIPIGIPVTILVILSMVVLQLVYLKISEKRLDILQEDARKEVLS